MSNQRTYRAIPAAILILAVSSHNCLAIGKIMSGEQASGNKAGSDSKAPQQVKGSGTRSPKVGQAAPNIQWTDSDGKQHSLEKLTAKGPAVVLVLRGWPGYQCGICNRQVGQFIDNKAKFEELGVHVVMIYPGPADLLEEHAKEFQAKRVFDDSFHYVIDPDYGFTNTWGLRWEAPKETAYPATYIVGKGNKIEFADVSKSHGGRAKAAKVLKQLEK